MVVLPKFTYYAVTGIQDTARRSRKPIHAVCYSHAFDFRPLGNEFNSTK